MSRSLGRWRVSDAVDEHGRGLRTTRVRDAAPPPAGRTVHIHVHGYRAHDQAELRQPKAPRKNGLEITGSARDQQGNNYQLKIWGPGPTLGIEQPGEDLDADWHDRRRRRTGDAIARWVRNPDWHNHPSALAEYQKRLNAHYGQQ